jgi:hypothetical protein
MKLTEEQEKQIINFGAFEYSSEKMANILMFNLIDIVKEMKDKNSTFFKLYQKGKDTSDYVIDLKLFELGKSGDVKAIEKFEQRKFKRLNSE